MNGPRIVCVCCMQTEVSVYMQICTACQRGLDSLGAPEPAEDTPPKVQIGPTDI
ncbi:hypothetical protein BH10PSE18_BH10PSE18_18780 [soil metagenome]